MLAQNGKRLADSGTMTVRDRLKALRGKSSYRQFSERVGANTNSVRRYELGCARVPMDYVEAVCSTFGISADWLIFGVEAPARDAAAGDTSAREEAACAKRSVMINGERVRIICVPVLNRVPAGAPAEMLDDMPVGFGLEGVLWVPDPGDRNAYALTAWGDSMDPVIRNGERFVVSPRRAHGFTAGIAVLRMRARSLPHLDGEVCVKHVRVRRDCVDVSPANPRYAAMRFEPGEVTVLGKVLHVVGGLSDAM
jgi:phage repressor protein C with HTH and peptisase S24 domain